MEPNAQTNPAPGNGAAAPAEPRLRHLERRLLEAFDELWDAFVDPADAMYDADGSRWTCIGAVGSPGSSTGLPFANEQQLAAIRAECRALAVTNEFAINGHENRVSYIVGSGHTYRATPRRDRTPSEALVHEVQAVVD